MDRLIYTSLTAMRASMARQTAIGEQSWRTPQTPGFRADMAETQALWLTVGRVPDSARHVAPEEVLERRHEARAAVTWRPAATSTLRWRAMRCSSCRRKDGEEAYTRRGDLQISSSGF
jgi:flagellar basal-body rod protein FlgF